jgi:hypothetical protein
MNEKEVEDEITRPYNEWIYEQHATEYLSRANDIPHRKEGESVLFDYIPLTAKRILDLGMGDGSFAIHDLTHQRKYSLYTEVFLHLGQKVFSIA